MNPACQSTSFIQRLRLVIATLLGIVMMGLSFPVMASQLETGALGHPVQVGPVNAENGFPVWYKDETGKRMQLCLDKDDPMCGIVATEELPNPDAPISFPDNFPHEAFYQLAGAGIDTASEIRVTATFALEAAFLQEIPRHGDQIVFGRVRFVVRDLPSAGVYRITHPYGQDIFTAESDGDGAFEFRFTEDIGGMSGTRLGGAKEFRGALSSRVGPFLQWDTEKPAGYLGNPDIEHTITGSPYVDDYGDAQNYLRIEGPFQSADGPFTKAGLVPNVSINDPAFTCTNGITESCLETNLFTVMGKEAVNGGVGVEQATYSQTPDGDVIIDVFASSIDSQALVVRDAANGTYFSSTLMRGDNGLYFARIKTKNKNAIPPQIKVENVSDNPVSSIVYDLKDRITATAEYNSDTNILKVNADSSDDGKSAVLSVEGYGTLTASEADPSSGELNVTVQAPPMMVTVNSASGGTVTLPVKIIGAEFAPIPVDAFAGVDQTIVVGNQVVLDGSGSTGEITGYTWTQTSGTAVTLDNADAAIASFTAPAEPTTMTFQLTVDGPGGPKSDTINIKVVSTITLVQADAGADQTVDGSTTVTLDGSGSKGDVTGYAWTQKEGPAVTLTNADSAVATFTAPSSAVPATLVFELTVQGSGGPQTDTVSIIVSPVPAPVANAGADQTAAAGAALSLDGSGSTGKIDSYSWKQTGGTDVTLTNENSVHATFTAPESAGALTFELTVQGPGGTHTDTVTVNITPAAPIAVAGTDQSTAAGAAVTLDASGSTGVIDTYTWTQTAGPAVTLSNADTASATFTAPDTVEPLTFELTVRGPGGTATDTVSVTITPDAPVANAGTDQTMAAGSTVTLDGSGSTGVINSYLWTQIDGPVAALTGAGSVSATFIAPVVTEPTTLVFELKVEGPGGSNTSRVSIALTPVAPPVANAGPDQTGTADMMILLDGSNSTGSIESYEWTQTEGPTVTLIDANTDTAAFTAPALAEDTTFVFTLVLEGPAGSSSDTVTVTITPPAPPVADAGADQTEIVGHTVTLSGSGSTGYIDSYEWIQTGGPNVTLSDVNSATPTFTAPSEPATLTFQLTVTGPGGTETATVTITVKPPAPVANAGVNQRVGAGTSVTLDGSGSSGIIDSYMWTQIDGPSVSLVNANSSSATFTASDEAAVLTFELTVEGPGGKASSVVTVNVSTAPIANGGADQTAISGSSVTLDGTGSTGDILSYTWTQTDGPAVELSNANGAIATLTAPAVSVATTLTFNLTVEGPGGSDVSSVAVIVQASAALSADAGVAQTVVEGVEVTLDGSASTGEITEYMWTETTGAVEPLYGVKPTFTAPRTAGAEGMMLNFTLTVTGPGGTKTSNVQINIKNFADAGTDQKVAQGTAVTLSGAASIEATSYSWIQISGPTVVLNGADTANPTFLYPKSPEPVVFELTTRGPLGTDTDIVEISTDPGVITIDAAEFRTSKGMWRVEGTSTVFGPNVKVALYNGDVLLTTVDVGADGEWSFADAGPVPSGTITAESTAGGKVSRTVLMRR